MMREGYAGADQSSRRSMFSNTMAGRLMRPDSVGDDLWEEIVEYLPSRDKNLKFREWFEAENPFGVSRNE